MKEIRKKPRYQAAAKNEGVFKGRKWVKKAGAFVNYTCFNTLNKADVFIWE